MLISGGVQGVSNRYPRVSRIISFGRSKGSSCLAPGWGAARTFCGPEFSCVASMTAADGGGQGNEQWSQGRGNEDEMRGGMTTTRR
eukprot:331097-Pyramimonas_sp.AAC.1